MDMEFPRCSGTQIEKSGKFQQMGGSAMKLPGTENPRRWGQTGEKTLWGYGNFLESLIKCSKCFIVQIKV